MWETRTYENLMREAIENAPRDVDTSQGSIFFDAIAAACLKLENFYSDLQRDFNLAFIATATGESLDQRAAEYQVFRRSALPATYSFFWEGITQPDTGERFFTDGLYFELSNEGGELRLVAEEPGTLSNSVISGTPAIPVNNIIGLTSTSFGERLIPGVDLESDDDLRDRVRSRISRPAENNNRQHYKLWAESIVGVGRARIIPLAAGANTVLGLILDTEGGPASGDILSAVQEYIDPRTLGHIFNVGTTPTPFGDGLGDGVSSIGAHFAAVAPAAVPISVTATIETESGADFEQIVEAVNINLRTYLRELALAEDWRPTVRISSISSIIYGVPGVADHFGLALNGGSGNLALSETQVAILGEVTLNAT